MVLYTDNPPLPYWATNTGQVPAPAPGALGTIFLQLFADHFVLQDSNKTYYTSAGTGRLGATTRH